MPVKFLSEICEKRLLETIGQYAAIHAISGFILNVTEKTPTYNILKKENVSWSCIECSKSVFPFSKLDNTNFLTTITGKNLKFITVRKKHNTQEGILIDRINDALNTSDLENSSTYFSIDEFNEHFVLTHLMFSMLFILISLPFLIILIN